MSKATIAALLSLALSVTALAPAASGGMIIEFAPKMEISNEFTDNVLMSPDNKKSSMITVISPGFTAGVRGKRSAASLSYMAGYSMYSESSENNALRQSLEFSGESDVSKRTHFSLSNNLVQTEEPTSTSDPVENRNRATLLQNDAQLSLAHQFDRHSGIQVLYGHNWIKSDDDNIEDSIGHTPSIHFKHRFDPYHIDLETGLAYTKGQFKGKSPDVDISEITVGLSRMFTKRFKGFITYSQTMTQYKENREDYDIYGFSLGFDSRMTRTFDLRAEAGYFVQLTDNRGENSDFSASITASKTLKRAAIGLNGAAGYQQSYLDGENLGLSVYYQINGNCRYRFTRLMNAGLDAFYRIDDYQETLPERTDKTLGVKADMSWQILETLFVGLNLGLETTNSDNPSEIEDIYSMGASLSYQWARRIGVSIMLDHRQVDAQENADDYQENRIVFKINLTPERPFRTVW